jgi:hypothetical protein
MPGKKKANRKRPLRPPGATVDAYSIKEFCDAHGIGVATYYDLRKIKQQPREMRVGKRWLISKEAAAEWRRAREENR